MFVHGLLQRPIQNGKNFQPLNSTNMGIYIRFRKGANGNYSAYLDSYHKGKRSNTYTDITVTEDYSKPLLDRSGNPKKNEKGQVIYPKVKSEDKEKMEILERLKLEKEIEIASNKFTVIKREKKISVVAYIREVAKSKKIRILIEITYH
jgi:hypothetical protein